MNSRIRDGITISSYDIKVKRICRKKSTALTVKFH